MIRSPLIPEIPTIISHRQRETGTFRLPNAIPLGLTENRNMKETPDMRGRIVFPPRPSTKEEIFEYPSSPWYMACALVGKYDRWQVNTYRKLYGKIADDYFYRDIMEITRHILDESRNIISPPAFLDAQFKLAAEGKHIYR